MAKDYPPGTGDGANQAMQRALEAEERAREAIEGCRAQAEALRGQARADAERIGEHADRRIEWVHRHCAEALERQLAGLESEGGGDTEGQPPWADTDTLARAAEALAAALTSPEGTGDNGEDSQA